MTKRWWISLIAAAAVTGVTVGCQQETTTSTDIRRLHGERFRPSDEPRAVDDWAYAQAAAGARSDATLYGLHFDTHGLNSLGRAKLALMLRSDEPIDPMVVYLDLPTDMTPEGPHTSVTEFLKSRGLTEAQIKLVDGVNPKTIHSAAATSASLKNMAQQQGAQPAGTPGYAEGGQTNAAPPAAATDSTAK